MMNTKTGNLPGQTKGLGSFVAGVLLCVAGGLMMLGFGLGLIGVAVSARYINSAAPVVAGAILLALFLIGCALTARGARGCSFYSFGQKVRGAMQGKPRERLLLLSQVTGRDYTRLVRDLRELAARGIYPGGYVDLNRREFVVMPGGPQPPIVYGNTQLKEKKRRSVLPIYSIGAVFLFYALLFPLYRVRDFVIVTVLAFGVSFALSRVLPEKTVIVEEPRKVEPPKPPEKINTGNTELDQVLTTAMEYMNELTALDIAITNERIDKPIQELVHICKQIFDYIKKTPQKVGQIRQFMNYYLPTTIKLLKNYDELSREPVKGQNIREAMTKIEDTMDTILRAFQRELDDLYMDKAMDISVDIEVLQNMMEQEGLSGGILSSSKGKGEAPTE